MKKIALGLERTGSRVNGRRRLRRRHERLCFPLLPPSAAGRSGPGLAYRLGLLLFAVLALLAACSSGDDDSAASSASSTTTTSAPSSTTATTEKPSSAVKDAEGTARAWLKAVARGDDATAVAMLSPRSLASIGGAEGYRSKKIELAEGWGAWGRAAGVELTPKALPFPKDVAVVILHGDVSQEGPPRESWNALPIVATSDGDRVEPFLDFGAITADPAEGGKIANGDTITVTTSTSRDAYVILDTADAVMPALQDIGERSASWIYAPTGLDPGLHALTFVIVGDGVEAQRFEYTVG